MPFALITIGLMMIVSGLKDTQSDLGKQLVSDFTGEGNFVYWVVAIFVIGGIGYIPSLEKFSRAFLALVLLSLFLANGGFFAKFSQAISSGTAHAPEPKASGDSGSSGTVNGMPIDPSSFSGSFGGGGGDDLSVVASLASAFA